MKRIPRLASVMTPFPTSVDIKHSAEQALQLMAEHNFHHLPVTENHKPVGLITEAELLRAVKDASVEASQLKLRTLCSQDSVMVDINTPLDVVVETMEQQELDSVLVTRAEKVAGIFTYADACRLLVRILRGEIPVPDSVA